MNHQAAIRDYYRAFRDRDRGALERLLLPDFRHISPFGLYDDRDRMLDEIRPMVGQHWAEDVTIYGDGPDYLVRYRHSTGAEMVEHFRFKANRIAEIEVFVGRSAADDDRQTEDEEIE